MPRRTPSGPPPPPVVQRLRIRYAKRGRLRFTSHRDFARAFERALRRAEIPMALLGRVQPAPEDQLRRRVPDRGGQRGRVPRDRARPRDRPRADPPRPRRCPAGRAGRARDRPGRPGIAAPSASRRRTGASSSPASTRTPCTTPSRRCSRVPKLTVERVTKDGRRTRRCAPRPGQRQGASHARERGACDTGRGCPAGDPRRTTRRHSRRVADRRRSRPRRTGGFGARGAGTARRARDGQRPAGSGPHDGVNARRSTTTPPGSAS